MNPLIKILLTSLIIMTAAHDRYAVKAFDLGATDYILKPFTRDRFNQAIDRFLDAYQSGRKKIIKTENLGFSFKSKNNFYLFAFEDILYLTSLGKHTILHTKDEDSTPLPIGKSFANDVRERIGLLLN